MHLSICSRNGRRGAVLTAVAMAMTLLLMQAEPTAAEDSGCLAAAKEWIAAMEGCDAEVLQRHAQMACMFAERRVQSYRNNDDGELREDVCRHQVLMWAHNEACLYFREVTCPDSWTACRDWSRKMYEQCVENDVEWFE